MITIRDQIFQLAVLFLSGIALGFLLDFYRLYRYLTHPGVWTTIAQDAFFWVGFASLFFAFLLIVNNGVVRGYVFLCLLTGLWVYSKVLSWRVKSVLWFLARGIKKSRK